MSEIVWRPVPESMQQANMTAFIRQVQAEYPSAAVADYPSLYQWSIRHPEQFWPELWDYCQVVSSRPREQVLEHRERMPGASWFVGSRLNFAQNLLRYRDDRPALVFVGEDGVRSEHSHAELYREVARLARGLRAAGVTAGDRVAAFLPNIPEAVIAMLATASIGAVWSSCSPDFGVQGVLDRFGQIAPKVLLVSDGYRFKGKVYDSMGEIRQVVAGLEGIETCVVVPFVSERPELPDANSFVTYAGMLGEDDGPELEFAQLPFDHPLYILYSSGTTGPPKCIVHGAGGTLLQHLKELALHTDLKREDTIFYFTTCGWMMWNWLVSSLALGARVVLFDGFPFYPGPGRLFDLAQQEGISVFGISARYLAAVEKAGVRPVQSHDLSAMRAILSTGSPLLPENYDFVYRDVKPEVQLCSISGGTDIVSCFALGNPLLPVRRGELQCLGLGMRVEVYSEDGKPVEQQKGELVCTAPFPSMPVGFWNDADGSRYRHAYFERFPGVWSHGDYASTTQHGGLIIYGRSDAVLNPGGVRIGSAEIYRQVDRVPEVLESLVVGQRWHGDERIVLFIKLRPGIELESDLVQRIRKMVRDNTSPRHVPARVLQVPDIPRTRSNKLAEIAVRNIIHGQEVTNRQALANPEALDAFAGRPELE
jgi:acetoacetyl-CoA synthetase